MPKNKQENTKGLGNPMAIMATAQAAKSVPTFVWVCVVLGVAYGVYKITQGADSILEKVGLKDDENDKTVNNYTNTNDYIKAFNPQYHNTIAVGTILPNRTKADGFAMQIWDSFYFFNYVRRANDLEEQVYDVYNQLANKAQMSWVADVFSQNYKQDLYTFLKDKLSNAEMVNIINIIKTKPDITK